MCNRKSLMWLLYSWILDTRVTWKLATQHAVFELALGLWWTWTTPALWVLSNPSSPGFSPIPLVKMNELGRIESCMKMSHSTSPHSQGVGELMGWRGSGCGWPLLNWNWSGYTQNRWIWPEGWVACTRDVCVNHPTPNSSLHPEGFGGQVKWSSHWSGDWQLQSCGTEKSLWLKLMLPARDLWLRTSLEFPSQ